MLSLPEVQNLFKNSIIDKRETALDNHIFANDLTSQRRLQVYRNNFLVTLTESLQSLYPTILKLVGEDFFDGAAKEYVLNYPPTSGDIHEFGDKFADFLTVFPPAQSLPYLPEVTRLEWAYHTAFHAADTAALDLSRLKNVSEAEYGELKFTLHPSSRLFNFQYPILRIWQMCQEPTNDQENIDLAAGGIKILVIRRQLEVTFEKLSEGEFAFLSAFDQTLKFAEACSLALDAEADFDINHYLQKHLLSGTICKLHYSTLA